MEHAISSHALSLTAGGTASVSTHHGGLTMIAANETVTIGAHADALQLVSEQGLTITSTESEIQVLAQDSVTLFGGGAAVELKGANITFKASGTFTIKAASTAFSGGGNAASADKLPGQTMSLVGGLLGSEVKNKANQGCLLDIWR